MNKNDIQNLFYEYHFQLDEDAILSMNKFGFYTVTSTETDKYVGRNLKIIAKNFKGIISLKTLQRTEFYKSFFGNKKLLDENINSEYIYLMLNKRNYYIKIGKSKRPIFREKTLQADEPDIELITFWQAPSIIEKKLHNQFKQKECVENGLVLISMI